STEKSRFFLLVNPFESGLKTILPFVLVCIVNCGVLPTMSLRTTQRVVAYATTLCDFTFGG
ncbi:MAG: hypothetical protein IKY68_00275, partial [Alistipes sp.]|nr:hypothetical protein [Alistipes sp.]